MPSELAEYFSLLVAIYQPDPTGKLLVEWMKEDWQLFEHPKMDVPGARCLLADILDNGEIVRKPFSPSQAYKSDELDRWETLCEELMYTNRYFPDAHIHGGRLSELLAYLEAEEMPGTWYRARITQGDSLYSVAEMGAPPKRLASHGRANPPGIPYLYLGSSPETAVSEVRPHTGEHACVAEFAIPPDLKLVDLRNPRGRVSPFLLSDEDEIGLLRADSAFLERLGEELTRPVLPQGAAIDYVPSQYLCEFIKKQGYDGVVYRSSVSDGINLALFDPAKAIAGQVSRYHIARVSVDVRRSAPA